MKGKVTKAVSRLDAKVAVSMREIEGSDLVLGVGSDPINEAPMLAMAMRQAQRNGGTVIMIDPRPLFLPFQFDHLPVGIKDIDPCLSLLIKEALNRSAVEELGSRALQFFDALPRHPASDPLVGDRIITLGQKLKKSQKPVIVCGTDIVPETTPSFSADLALLLQSTKERVGLFYTLPGPNTFGAALLSKEGSAQHIIEEIEKGTVKGLVLVECDPFWSFHDRERLSKALGMLDLLLVLDYVPSQSVERADIVLPTVTALERIGSSFINQEGRAQFSPPVHGGGLPIQQVSEGSHPPRAFLSAIPGGEPKAAGEIFMELASVMSVPGKEDLAEDIRAWLTRQVPVLERLDLAVGQSDGVRLIPEESPETAFSLDGLAQREERVGRAEDRLELLLIDWTFGTEELSSYSRYVHQAERSPQIMMHTDEASRLGLSHGDMVVLHLPGGSLTLDMYSVDNMAKGVAVMPRHRQLDWQKLNRRRMMIPVENLEKV
jgi:NADH-quinone oxidoreductase subunit G